MLLGEKDKMQSEDIALIVMLAFFFSIGMAIFLPTYFHSVEQIPITTLCENMFNPSSNYTNEQIYEHCIKYPESYGVNKD